MMEGKNKGRKERWRKGETEVDEQRKWAFSSSGKLFLRKKPENN